MTEPEFVEVDGWKLARLSTTEEPVIAAAVLGEKLGFSQTRDIRKIVKRMADAGKLPGIQTRATVARVARRGRGDIEVTVNEYFLTEAQALKVIAKSETSIADKILDEVIEVYVKWRKGALGSGLTESRVREIIAASNAQLVADLTKKLGAPAASDDPFAGKKAAEEFVLGPLRRYVSLKLWLLDLDKSKRSKVWFDAEKAVRKAIGYPRGDGTTWSRLPESKLAHAANTLMSMINDVRRDLQCQGRPDSPDSDLPLFRQQMKAKRKGSSGLTN